jgi:hypothetical protein
MATTDGQGRWVIAGIPSGKYRAQTEMSGFKTSVVNLNYNANQPSAYSFALSIASAAETVEVTAEAPQIDTMSSSLSTVYRSSDFAINGRNFSQPTVPGVSGQNAASVNVLNLQKRVSGVLPVRVDVPRAGTSFSFVRPLVLDEETKVTFSYKTR